MRLPAPLVVLAGASLGVTGCTTSPTTTTVTVGSVGPLTVEVADESGERRAGLMGRDDVPEGTGMLFLYPEPVDTTYWMGNVLVPLSIIWARDDRVVGVAEMTPCPAADLTCTQYSPGEPFDVAVETTGGAFTDAGVRVGDPVVVAP